MQPPCPAYILCSQIFETRYKGSSQKHIPLKVEVRSYVKPSAIRRDRRACQLPRFRHTCKHLHTEVLYMYICTYRHADTYIQITRHNRMLLSIWNTEIHFLRYAEFLLITTNLSSQWYSLYIIQ